MEVTIGGVDSQYGSGETRPAKTSDPLPWDAFNNVIESESRAGPPPIAISSEFTSGSSAKPGPAGLIAVFIVLAVVVVVVVDESGFFAGVLKKMMRFLARGVPAFITRPLSLARAAES